MCGIAGIVGAGFGAQSVQPKVLSAMENAIHWRGPDDHGIWTEAEAGLAHRRLSIIDLSTAGSQPMVSADGRYVIVHNGEVYNWEDIRKRLRLSRWKSKTDTETIVEAFAERGPDCLQDFIGMFGFAIWDRRDHRLFVARDRLGKKPLVWAVDGKHFYFASEAKAIHAAGFPRAPNWCAFRDYLRWGLIDHDTKTFFRGIQYLEPGHYMWVVPAQEPKITRYWRFPELTFDQPQIGLEEAKEEFRALLIDSIRLRSHADVRVGVSLSGGVDSSVLMACVAEYLGSSNLEAFTYHFGAEKGEGAISEQTAKDLGVPLTLCGLMAEEVPSYIKKALFHQEAPITSLRVLGMHRQYEVCRDHDVTVLLEGSGGDELGSGYEYYYAPHVMDMLARADRSDAVAELHRFMDRFAVPHEQRLERFLDCLQTVLRPGVSTQDGVSFVAPHCIEPSFLGESPYPAMEGHFPDWLRRLQCIDAKHIVLPRALRYTDRASMAASREVREPMLDHRIVELSYRTRPEARIGGGQQRIFMRAAAQKLLPHSLLDRPKQTIVDPQRIWLKRELKHWVKETIKSKTLRESGILKVAEVESEFDRYCREENPRTSAHILQFLNVVNWLEVFA